MTTQQWLALRTSAVLWVVWGLVHMLAGILTISQPAPNSIGGIADAVDPAVFHTTYHAATDAVINQHGFNLFWIGLTTLVAAVFIWRQNKTAIWVAALVGGLADVGYFFFMDLGGHVNFVPGTIMTLVSGSAVVLTGWVWFKTRSGDGT
ncbi:MAG: hypothetical protein AAF355_01145 [Myxococcota bacterium]